MANAGLNYNVGSPGIKLSESEQAQTIVATSTTIAAGVGNFNWGPCDTVVMINSEPVLAATFGTPTDENYKDWITAANFLAYSQDLRLVRVVPVNSFNACSAPEEAIQIKSYDHFIGILPELSSSTKTAGIFAKYPGKLGNEISVVAADKTTIDANPDHVLQTYINELMDEDSIAIGIIVNNVMVEFGVYSLQKNALTYSGTSNNLFTAINTQSEYIYLVPEKFFTYTTVQVPNPEYDGTPGNNDSPNGIPEYIEESTKDPVNINVRLSGGTDSTIQDGDYMRGWELFADPDNSNVSLLMQLGASEVVGNYITHSIAAVRKDCIACVSPQLDVIIGMTNSQIVQNLVASSGNIGYSGFRFMDGNYKFQYDKYNNVSRWVPLNGDIAGIFAQTDAEQAPWFSPGGKTIQNCQKLAFYPTKANRDELYKYRINPVTKFNDTGTILYGDWTGSPLSSADNFVNVRRMLNYVEKSISNYARIMLWQLNDDVTNQKFIQTVEPFLRDVQGGRGIAQYQVIADDTVNTTAVRDAGRFIAIIRVRPVFSIRWCELSFTIIRGQNVEVSETII